MTAGYAAFQTNLSITAKGNIKEPSKIIQSWGQYSNEDFHTDYYRENIVSATFLDTNQVASNATESWDVSEDGKGGVKAWVVPNAEDNTKYDLYIGAKDGVIANEDSSYLFYNFIGMKTVDFQNNFDTINTTNMSLMFHKQSNLRSLNLCFFDTNSAIYMRKMFQETFSLETIYVGSNWATEQADTTDMFLYSNISSVTTGQC